MNPEIRRRWTDALQSGDYVQGKDTLRVNLPDGTSKFCCLGVLCDLYAQDHPEEKGWSSSEFEVDNVPSFWADGDWNDHYLPIAVAKWAGLTSTSGMIPGIASSLAAVNDEGASFREIAQIIKEHL